MTLECIGLDKDGLFVRIPGPDPDEIARVYVFQHADDHATTFRHDLPPPVREPVRALGPEAAFRDHEAVTALLATHCPCPDGGTWQTYLLAASGLMRFPAHIPMLQ